MRQLLYEKFPTGYDFWIKISRSTLPFINISGDKTERYPVQLEYDERMILILKYK